MNGDNKRFHLKMIEDTISRMSSNSFLIKGWSLTAIGGLLTLYFANLKHLWSYNLLWLGLGACLLFWLNDAYYLQQERNYRKLYEIVRNTDEDNIDFNMKVPTPNSFCCMFRPIFLFSYLPIFVTLLLLIYVMKP